MKREVCSAESRSVEPMKMKTIQAMTGSQYFTNRGTKNETTTAALVPTAVSANCRAFLRNALLRERRRLAQTPYKLMSQLKLTQPLVFEPIFMERVWGGRRLESLYGKRLPSAALIGESWEIVDRPEAQSVVHEGPLRGATLHDLWVRHRAEVFGEVPNSPRFPILCKLLDAQENLSLQVHPPRAVAKKLGGEPKSEMWYIASAAPKATLYAGLKKGVTREIFTKALEQGKVEKHLHAIEVQPGDAMFLPSGRMHALGAGVVLVEIQENSDTTYRIYDWNRAKKGRPHREMHLAEAMQCVDFEDVEPELLRAKGESLVRHELFEVEEWKLDVARDVAPRSVFAIVCCLTGSVRCANVDLWPGSFCLVPASLVDRKLGPQREETRLLRITLAG
jgi:mannose-6-phosphate isomerase